jgi:hypothetical protein
MHRGSVLAPLFCGGSIPANEGAARRENQAAERKEGRDWMIPPALVFTRPFVYDGLLLYRPLLCKVRGASRLSA